MSHTSTNISTNISTSDNTSNSTGTNILNKTKMSFYRPHEILNHITKAWLFVALLGQWMFALYIFIQFGVPAITGELTSEGTSRMIMGLVDGDRFGNAMLLIHLLPAILLSVGGILQLIPIIRVKYPTFHRWNGRMFLTLGLLGAITGLYLTWGRGARLSDIGSLGLTLNGLLIPVAVILAWKFAVQRQFQKHTRFAIHAFILINGVWSFRLYLMGWFLLNQGSNGNSKNIDGPADIALSFASYLLPMAIAEIYFWAKRQKSNTKVSVANLFMLLGLLITTIGVVAATMFMWWPRIIS